MINYLRLLRNDMLVLLPEDTEQIIRSTHSGLELATLRSQTYNPVYGTIIAKGPNCSYVEINDIVFFQIFTFSVAKERCYGDDFDKQFENEYNGTTNYAFKDNGRWYMILREENVYLIKNKEGITPINGYVIAEPLPKDDSLLIALTRDSQKQHRANMVRVVHSCYPDLIQGDIAHTLRHCDITIEESTANPILPPNWFIIEHRNIIAKVMDKSYKAGVGRVIIRPDEIKTETEGGLINLSLGKEKLLTGEVISVGEKCTGWSEGIKILYARNSGMPIPDTDLLILQDIDVFAEVLNQPK